jgi:hypothetical protein
VHSFKKVNKSSNAEFVLRHSRSSRRLPASAIPMKTKQLWVGLAVLLTLLLKFQIHAEIVFKDDFEASLSQWSGRLGGQHHGTIVTDPLNSTNHVLTFTGLATGGDIYSTPIGTNAFASGSIVLSFDFLGLAPGGSVPFEYGGFIGIDTEPGEYYWLAGTYPEALSLPPPSQIQLAADGSWHHYEIELSRVLALTNAVSFQVVMEDWADRGSVPGDVFFDNVEVISGLAVDIRVSQVELCWQAMANTTYQLEYRSSLTTNNWTPLSGPVAGAGARFCTNDVVPIGEPRRFYRVIVVKP